MSLPELPLAFPALDRLLPGARLAEIDRLDLAAPPAEVWRRPPWRPGALAAGAGAFAIRTWSRHDLTLRIDDLVSTAQRPGFQVLIDEEPFQFAVGAIGRSGSRRFLRSRGFARRIRRIHRAGLRQGGLGNRADPGRRRLHLRLEVRVDATDEESWRKFRRYFRFVGIGSHFIRRWILAALARELGTLPSPGDDSSSKARARTAAA